MPKGIFVVLTDPADSSREQDYNHWYDTVHGPEIVALPGFTAFSRFKLADGARRPEGTPEYCAVYEMESDDLNETVSGMMKAIGAGELHMTDALKVDPPPTMLLYEVVTERTAG
ncbi:MAG: hypothetical protein JF603_11250 [Acidobacteria bacterium]|nr:hypothetical protein [Acidobacteriota bacterium]